MAQVSIQYTADISQLNSKLDEIINKQNQIISSSTNAGRAMSNAASRASNDVSALNNQLNNLQGFVASAFAISKIIDFTKSIVDAERKMELLQNRLNFLAGSQQKGEEMFERLFSISKRLGINIEDLAEGMASFGIAATQAGFSALKTEKIFVQVATGLRAAGATSLQTQRSFYALQQMMSKGVVAAEELRRQLGESLPGAFSLMVKAYNRLHPAQQLTELEFTKLQEQGKIISRDILPEFAKVIEETFGPALSGKKNSLDAAISRVNTELLALKLNLADTKTIKFFVDTVAAESNRLNMILQSQESGYMKLARVIGDVLLPLGFLNNDLVNKQRALNAISAAESTKINEDILNQAEELLKMGSKERDAKLASIQLSLKEDQQVVESYKIKIKVRDLEIAFRKKIQAQEIKDGTKLYATEGGMANAHAKQLEEINRKYYDHAQKGEFLAAQKRIKIAQGIVEEIRVSEDAISKLKDEELEKQRKAQEQFLRDEVARAEKVVLQTQEGSIAQSKARAVFAEKQKNLNEFMAKSDARMQLERLKGELKTNEELEKARAKTADALSQDVLEDEIDPSKDPNLKAIDKTLETYRKNKDKISEAIAAPFMDAMQKEMLAATNYYLDLIRLTEENSEERVQLEEALQQELDNIRQKFADKDDNRERRRLKKLVRAIQEAVNVVGGIYEDLLFQDLQRDDIALRSLEKRLDKGLISEQEYEKQKEFLLKRQFETEKSLQIARAVMSGANAILNILGGPLAPLAPVLIPITAGITASQIAIIQSQVPAFKDGVIDLKGPGTETSDSILARLSKGESIMTAAETRKHKDVLEAIRNDRLPSLIAEKYIIPAYKDSMDKPRKATSEATSMELAFQTAELVQAVKSNKVINLSDKSVNRLASAMNKNAAMDKKMRRRGL
jgi:tape measure domain-containing protein